MNRETTETESIAKRDRGFYPPLVELVLARLREFTREPEAIFWVYGFPILMMVALGLAFRTQPVERVAVDIIESPGAEKTKQQLLDASDDKKLEFSVDIHNGDTARSRLRSGKTDLVLSIAEESGESAYQYRLDKTRAESRLARSAVHEALQESAGRKDIVPALADEEITEPGSRYIDFLVPGLLGMSLMGGGMWGVGFVIVDMRIRKLLKRFLATPMKRSDFLLGIICSRLVFMVPEVLIVLLIAWLLFGVIVHGSLLTLLVLVLLGAFMFAGVGLLIASRAKTIETVSGLMNLTMLPMWLLSGIFFATDRFPAAMQPLIQALPLTPLISSLRAVMLEGATLASQWQPIAIMAAYAVVSFAIALKIFRWN